MKKLIFIIICLLLNSLGVKAQFEKNSWIVNPAITGLEYSYSDANKNHLGFNAQGGAFLIDDLALLLKLGADWTNEIDTYSVGVGGRYYFNRTGIYVGSGLYLTRQTYNGSRELQGHKDEYGLNAEIGYAFFLNKAVTIEPGVYYDLSFKNSNLSKLGLKIGFGFYF
ncbi:hypothetical protein EZS27_005759 [termite gut metagenome]|jgi:hypothetical protein|uniref:Outer membrane protein beta-barrel domain-containing protein n=1 Tax=termite gut metagenome TaxID=433724 RepID=A0A5J4SLJ5_9ZZZZ